MNAAIWIGAWSTLVAALQLLLLLGAAPLTDDTTWKLLLPLLLLPLLGLAPVLLWLTHRVAANANQECLDGLPDPVLITTTSGHIVYGNSAWKAVCRDLTGQSDLTSLTTVIPEFRAQILPYLDPNRDQLPHLIATSVTASGRRHWRMGLRSHRSGDLVKVSLCDITQQQQSAELGLLLNNCVSHIHDAIIVTQREPLDEPGPRIVFVNRAVETMTGYSPEQLIGQSPRILQGPDTDQQTLAEIRAALVAGVPTEATLVNYRADGSSFWNHMTIVPVPVDTEGSGGYFVGIGRDITTRREQELRLQQSERNLRRLTRAQRQVREQERTRIARDLHDDLGQRLTALKLDLGLLLTTEPRLPASQRLKVERLIASAQAGIEQVRDIAANLRPALLEHLGFLEAVRWCVEEADQRLDAAVTFEQEILSARPLQHELAVALYRILQEALTNISRHAKASQVEVAVVVTDDYARLSVCDDGRGFEPAELDRDRDGCGLLGMRERAAELGGHLQLESAPNNGCSLTVTVPLLDEKNTPVTG